MKSYHIFENGLHLYMDKTGFCRLSHSKDNFIFTIIGRIQTGYNLNGTRMCYRVKTQNVCACVSPHIATRVSFCSNIIITNLRPLSIIYMLPYLFFRPSEHSKLSREYSDYNLSHVPRIKCLNNRKNTVLTKRNSFMVHQGMPGSFLNTNQSQ